MCSGGGYYHWKVVRDLPQSRPSYFRPVGTPYPSNLPSMLHSCAPHFQFLEKFAFAALFLAKISAFKMQNFSNLRSQDPSFFKENPLPRPHYENLCSRYPPEKSWVPPPTPPPPSMPCLSSVLRSENVAIILLYLEHEAYNKLQVL